MDKKTLPLIIILVLIIAFYGQILTFLGLMPEAPTPSVQDTTRVSEIDSQPAEERAAAVSTSHMKDSLIASPTSESVPIVTDTSQLASDTLLVSTNLFDVALSSQGAGVISLRLKEYGYRDGTPIEMLPEPGPGTPEVTFAGNTFSTSSLHFQCSLTPGEYDARRDTLQVTYTYQNPAGGQIERRFIFYPDAYHFDLLLRVDDREQLGFERKYNLIWNTPVGVTEPQPATDYDAMQAVAMMAGSRETLDDFEDDKLSQSLTGNTSWAGVRAKYFAAMLIPRSRQADGVFAEGVKLDVATPDGRVEQRRITVGLEMPFASVSSFSDSITVFVGPLDYSLLTEYNVDLQDMLDIGTTWGIGWLIKPFAIGIIWLLPRMYDLIPNYGVVIILFALLVKIVTLPLSMKSFKSMQAMRDLQPKIEAIKQKHKKNPQAMNAEVMKLYKTHGVSPMSGCLPMLPQMPLFFAMFSVFRSTILLRDAPFVWFISDLSIGATGPTDPYIILVVIMVLAQFASQKLTMPSTQQNKAMGYIMPLFFGFIFYKFAAGLVLYWICFSIFSLLDYVLFKRKKNLEVKTA